MALEDMKPCGKWSGNMYTILRRFLDHNLGQPWSELYSKLCAVADINTNLGYKLRRAIASEVHDKQQRDATYRWADWFVDEDGTLQKYKQKRWSKSDYIRSRNKKPIIKICSKEEGPDIWYELVDIPDGPIASKYTKMHKAWFKLMRVVKIYSSPLAEWQLKYEKVQPKKGKNGYYKEHIKEIITQKQCSTKVVRLLQAIALRKVDGKITKLYSISYDIPGLIAHVNKL